MAPFGGNGHHGAAQQLTWPEPERIARYREQSARFEQMAELETQPAARSDLLDLARQYAGLAAELEARLISLPQLAD